MRGINLYTLRKQMKVGAETLRPTNTYELQHDHSTSMEIEEPRSGFAVSSKGTVSKGTDEVAFYSCSLRSEQRVTMEVEESSSEMVSKVISWNARSINCIDKVKRFMKERATFTLIQETWKPEERVIQCLPTSNIMRIRPKDQAGGGTMTIWDSNVVSLSGKPWEVNQDSQIAKYILAGNRFVWLSSVYNLRQKY